MTTEDNSRLPGVIEEGDEITIQYQATVNDISDSGDCFGEYSGGFWPEIHEGNVVAAPEEVIKVSRANEDEETVWVAEEVEEWIEDADNEPENSSPTEQDRSLDLTKTELEIVGMLVDSGDVPGPVREQGLGDEYQNIMQKIKELER